MWAGPVANWIKACLLIEDMDAHVLRNYARKVFRAIRRDISFDQGHPQDYETHYEDIIPNGWYRRLPCSIDFTIMADAINLAVV